MELKELYKYFLQHPIITTDSRDCPQDSIFVALKGDNFDGNAYADKALQQGCAVAVIDEKKYLPKTKATDLSTDGAGNDKNAQRYVVVDDCLQTLKDLAREWRRQFDIPVIGITGTNGKTTTKELIASVLKEKYNVLYTQGNFNNDVGVPKTLLRLRPEHEIAVIEMGASHPGDIKTLVATAEPTCGIITNVGRAHLLGFGSLEGVMKTKGELYDFLNDRPVFINTDNEHLMQMASERKLPQLIGYSQSGQGRVCGEITECAPFLKFRWHSLTTNGHPTATHEVQTHLIGAYNIDNMLAAITIGLWFNVPEDAICHALENYVPTNNRSQLTVTKHNKLVVDAYNANPTSMAAAIENFRLMDVKPKMAILGMMGELGAVSAEEHQRVVDMLKQCHFDQVWLVGEEFMKTNCNFRKFRIVDDVKTAIQEEKPTNFYILIKGSNSVKLYNLTDIL